MVCTDCDQKWHQHPRRRSHRRQLLGAPRQAEFVSGLSSVAPSTGSFTRTSATSTSVDDRPVAAENDTAGIALVNYNDATNVVPVSSAVNGSSEIGELSSAFRHSDASLLLPRSVAEINKDLSLQSMFGVNDSLVSEHNSAVGQTADPKQRPENVERSNSRQFNSLTSDFQSALQSLQSVMNEVGSSMVAGSGPGGGSHDTNVENWNFSPTASKQTEVSRSSALSGSIASRSSPASPISGREARHSAVVGSADKNPDAVDDELAKLLAKTKYPPHVGAAGLPLATSVGEVKHVVSEQAAPAYTKPQNTGQTVESKSSGHPVQRTANVPLAGIQFTRPDVTPDIKGTHTVVSVQRTAGYGLPGPGIQNKVPEPKNDWTGNSSAQLGRHQVTTTIDRQKSQTLVKQRLEDSAGVVCARVGHGNDLGVSERLDGGDRAPAYHSKFADIHDEVCTIPYSFCVWFWHRVFRLCGSNGASFCPIKSKMAPCLRVRKI